ncbi:MAG: LuxR C-terminal-related transcriptional regulator [Acidobacteriota bacterium]
MSAQILATKLYIPLPRPKVVLRPRLIERLEEGLHHKLTLISAPAGFGKTTLLSEWVAGCERRVAWLSLDEGDNDRRRFLAYLVAALQTVASSIGNGVLGMLQLPQLPPTESLLTVLLNEVTATAESFILVLDDYHVIDTEPIDHILTFLVEHLPPQAHLVIATREDPPLPLARLRARGQLTELRVSDLRFIPAEAAEFLNQTMSLKLSAEDVAALEARTEGWIVGLQLAAVSLQGRKDAADFIKSFTGSHYFVLDYLVEEVLQRQPESIQTFLLRTSILDRLCGTLCDAILLERPGSGQQTLAYLERSNLFIVPLDNERRWYRYHHLFADSLRQRLLHQNIALSPDDARARMNELHTRASQWFEDHGLAVEAFRHAAAAGDVERAQRLIAGDRIPQHLRGAVAPILDWLGSLPRKVLDARPWLWWRHASLLLIHGQTTGVEEKLQSAEDALQSRWAEDHDRNLVGLIAAARAVLALTRYDVETMLAQSRRALEYLHPDSMITRATAYWTMGAAHFFSQDRGAARRAFTEAISLSQESGDIFTAILATVGLGNVEAAENRLDEAAATYRRVLQMASEQPLQIVHEAHLGLARVLYEWNDLDAAEQHARQGLDLAKQYDRVIDRFIICEVFLARLKLARGDVAGAASVLAKADQSVRRHHFAHRAAEVAAAQVVTFLHQGNLAAAERLAKTRQLPLSQSRVHLAREDASAALAVLEPLRRQAEAKGWQDERLKVMVLQSVAHHAHGEKDKALQLLSEALALAEPGGFVRLFVDEGKPMAHLLSEAAAHGMMPDYVAKLLAAFATETPKRNDTSSLPPVTPVPSLIEGLSQRELEVLRLIAQGLSNREISEQLFLALVTVKGHNQRIFGKLQVKNRTEAVARARELGLL